MTEARTVVSVKLHYNPKLYWFDPLNESYQAGDDVLVDTERGREIGLVAIGALEVTEKQIKDLNSPLKPVLRKLTQRDYDELDKLDEKAVAAMPLLHEMVAQYNLDMKPVACEYLFGGDKAVFYFSSEDRVDFRDMVRELAGKLHVRVELRQIGVRDEARILGGIAHCGEEFCCARLGGEFQPVSIRMAKEQDLPLNPTKISGACGRLMCCLRYEYEAYKDFKGRAPKQGALIETPLGQAKVIEHNTPREAVTMRLEDGKTVTVPLADFDQPPCGADGSCPRPCKVGLEAIERSANATILLALSSLEQNEFDFEADVLAETGSSERKRRTRKGTQDAAGNARGAQASNAQAGSAQAGSAGGVQAGSAQERARGAKQRVSGTQKQRAAGGEKARTGSDSRGSDSQGRKSRQQRQQRQSRALVEQQPGTSEKVSEKLRPGSRSSGLRRTTGGSGAFAASVSGTDGGRVERRDSRQRRDFRQNTHPNARQNTGQNSSPNTSQNIGQNSAQDSNQNANRQTDSRRRRRRSSTGESQ